MRRRVGLSVVAVLVALASSPARAQIRPCPGLGQGSERFKILLDDLDPTEAVKNDPLLKNFTNRLRTVLRGRLDNLNPSPTVLFEVLQCSGRRPRGPGDFDDPALVRALAQSNVVLEVWGVLDGTAKGGQIRERRADISYFVVPVRFDPESAELKHAMFPVTYPKARGSAADFLELFAQGSEIEAYVFLAVGLRKLRERENATAREYFCRAQNLMRRTWGPAPPGSQEKRLLEYAQKQARNALGAEPAARLVGENALCPSGGS